jgi:hypothetical protein
MKKVVEEAWSCIYIFYKTIIYILFSEDSFCYHNESRLYFNDQTSTDLWISLFLFIIVIYLIYQTPKINILFIFILLSSNIKLFNIWTIDRAKH